jgi:hypothetical protein
MFSREHSLESATYRKSARPATARSVFQVSMWVLESLTLPSCSEKRSVCAHLGHGKDEQQLL